MSKATATSQPAAPTRQPTASESIGERFTGDPMGRSTAGRALDVQRAERLGHRVGRTFSVGGRGVIQRLPAGDIEVGLRYRYHDFMSETEKVGTLESVTDGGLYSFDNGSAQGNDNVLAVVPAAEVDAGGGGEAEAEVDAEIEVDAEALEAEAVGGGGGEDGLVVGDQVDALEAVDGGVEEDAGGGGDAEPAPQTAAALIAQIAGEFNMDPVADKNLLSVALDVPPANYSVDLGDMVLDSVAAYLADWRDYTSCHDTARRFIGVFGDADVQATTLVQSEAAEPGEAALRRAALAAGADQLAGFLTDGRIVRVMFAGHSFMVMGRGDRADMLQSFANKFPIADSVAADTTLPIATARTHLRNAIGSADQATRVAAQTALSGHRIEDDKVYPAKAAWPNVELEYEVKALIDPADIMVAIRGILQAATDKLRDLGKIQ